MTEKKRTLITVDDVRPFAKNPRTIELLTAVDKLHRVVQYLSFAWGIDTPPDQMQANLDARMILIKLEFALVDEAELEERYGVGQEP